MSKRRRPSGPFIRATSKAAPPARMNPASDDTRLLQQARRLWSEKRWDEALAAFERAVVETPRNSRTLVDAARACGARYQFERAGALLQQLVALDPRDPALLAHAGESCRLIGRHAEAAQFLERAMAAGHRDPVAQLELAKLFERLHRLEAAFELAQTALAARIDWPAAQLAKARIERRLKREAEAEASLRSLLAKPVSDPDVFAEAWAELAQLCDRNGDYDGAMEATVYGKQLMLPRDAAERGTSEFILGRFQKMYDALLPSDLRRWADQSAGLASHPPLALLTGFPRSGTTLLEQVLDGHPRIVSSEERDIMGFEVFPALVNSVPDRSSLHDVLDGGGLDLLRRQQGLYFNFNESWLGEPLGQRLLLDKNPGSTLLLPVFLRVFPGFKTLFALRDPRDVILSCFMLYLPLNPLSVNFLTLERVARKYALDLRTWLKLREMFPAPWLEIRYEDLVADLPAQARRALEFLGFTWDDAVLKFDERARSKPVLSPTYAAVTQPVHNRAIGRWRHYADYLEPVLPILKPFVKAFGYPD